MIEGNSDYWEHACGKIPVVLLPEQPELDAFIQSEARILSFRYLAGDVDEVFLLQWIQHLRYCVIEGENLDPSHDDMSPDIAKRFLIHTAIKRAAGL